MTQKRTYERVEKVLRSDIRWAIRSGIGWNSDNPACFVDGKWVPYSSKCGVCAIGAHVIRNQPKKSNQFGFVSNDDVDTTAKSLRVPFEDAETIYFGVTSEARPHAESPGWYKVAQRIKKYANVYKTTRSHHAARRAAERVCPL